jgi:cysteine desulfurase
MEKRNCKLKFNYEEDQSSYFVLNKVKEFLKISENDSSEAVLYAKRSYQTIQSLIGAKNNDRLFLRNSSYELLKQIIFSVYIEEVKNADKNHFIILDTGDEYSNKIYELLEGLSCNYTTISTDENGYYDLLTLERSITSKTALVVASWSNPLIGVIQPIEQIAEICNQKQSLFLVDASHVVGNVCFSFEDILVDYLIFSGMSLCSFPIAGLFVKEKAPLCSTIFEENGECYKKKCLCPSFIALGAACEESFNKMDNEVMRLSSLRDKFEKLLLENIPNSTIFYKGSYRLPNISVVAIPNIMNESLLFRLKQKKIYPYFNNNISSPITEILIKSGVDPFLANCSLSFSFDETVEDILSIVKTIKEESSILLSLSKDLS